LLIRGHKLASADRSSSLDQEKAERPELSNFDPHLCDHRSDIAALHDRARALHDELAARLTEETNRRLYIVSVVTTVVMPATLVTGFFGMNTGGMLWLEQGHGTAFAFCVCLVAIFGTLLLLRWKRLL
jgi:Mg2+ and Co2+ transporter CorA